MSRLTIALLFASVVIVALTAAIISIQLRASSTLSITSTMPSPTSTVNAGTNASAKTGVTAYPTIDYGYDMTEDGPDMKQYANPDSTPGIPLYPQAELISDNCVYTCVGACTPNYRVNGEEQSKVEAFYIDALPKRGWEFLDKSTPEHWLYFQDHYYQVYYYSWKNTSDSGPARIYLAVGFAQEQGSTEIYVDIHTWPDPQNPPIHPQAKEVEVRDGSGFYTVNLTKAKIVDYYKKVMKQQGWCLNLKASTDSELNYFFDMMEPDERGWATIDMKSVDTGDSTSSNKANTSVQITTSGPVLRLKLER